MKSSPIDLKRVYHLFSQTEKRAAADFINREIAGRMHQKLELIRLNPQWVIDAGCGCGDDLTALKNSFPEARIVGLDASHAFLRRAQQKQSDVAASLWRRLYAAINRNQNLFDLVNGDIANFPFAAKSVDMIWSNLVLHWHPEPDQVFREWRRNLQTNGLLMFSCFGPDTFREIRWAFDGKEGAKTGESAPRTLPFVDMHDYGDMLVNSGFATPVMDMEIITLTYQNVAQLLTEVRAMGGNPLQTRQKGLMGKIAWRRMCDNLEKSRNQDGLIPLTLEIIYGHAFKSEAKKNSAEESIIEFRGWKK